MPILGVLVLFIMPPAWAGDVLLIVGDSLSAGYGVARSEAWPSLLQQRLNERALDVRVVNASISGITSATGRAMLPGLLSKFQPRWVVIELGANDGLRGLSLDALRTNIGFMSNAASEAGAVPILAGMRMLANYGAAYTDDFAHVYAAPPRGGLLIPFLLDGVAGRPEFNQPDGIHPNASGHRRMMEHAWVIMAPLFLPIKQVEGENKTVIDSPR